MKKTLMITLALLIANFTAQGQNLFLIGEKSYPCTTPIMLASNTNYHYQDLDVCLAKDATSGYFALSRKTTQPEKITGKLIIYLEDGNVITCNASEASEKVDDRAKALFFLTADQLNKLKASNIHTVKYTLTWLHDESFSASNKGIETREIINEFFKE